MWSTARCSTAKTCAFAKRAAKKRRAAGLFRLRGALLLSTAPLPGGSVRAIRSPRTPRFCVHACRASGRAQAENIVAPGVLKDVYRLQRAGDRGLRFERRLQGERHREHEQSSPASITKHAASRDSIKNAPSDPGERGASRRSSVMPRNSAANFLNRRGFPFFPRHGVRSPRVAVFYRTALRTASRHEEQRGQAGHLFIYFVKNANAQNKYNVASDVICMDVPCAQTACSCVRP